MEKRQRAKSAFLVNVLNMKEFAKTVALYLIGNGVELNGNTRIKTFADLGIVTGKNGKHYLIDTEGCGSGVALEDEREKIRWYRETVDEKEKVISFDMFLFVELKVDKAELDKVSVSDTVSLDKFVRLYNDRLERNFGNWNRFLETGIEPKY